jgi:hypothetical protein
MIGSFPDPNHFERGEADLKEFIRAFNLWKQIMKDSKEER